VSQRKATTHAGGGVAQTLGVCPPPSSGWWFVVVPFAAPPSLYQPLAQAVRLRCACPQERIYQPR
jgi:hypothetical protein